MQISRVLMAVLCAAGAVRAVETRTWQEAEMTEFERGSLTRLSLASDGRLSLAPVVKKISDPSVTFLWAVARDSKGNVYAGGGGLGGSKSKLFVVDPSGKTRTLAEIDGLSIQAIAIDRQDRIYVATTPDGKVYRVDAAGKAEVVYDPHAKYIWALAFSKAGDLYVATGDQGEIHRVKVSGSGAGTGSVFFRTEEAHARSLAVDANDNLIVGTDPSGLIIRVTPAGEGFVLYQAPKREITAVAVAPDGTLYASGVGNKVSSPLPALPLGQAPLSPSPIGGGNTITLTRTNAAPPPTLGGTAPAVSGGSEIYHIQADGYARRVWNHGQDLVYALAFDARGRLIAGAGNHGSIFRIDSDHSYTRLLNVEPTQVTAFCSGAGGQLYAVTGNIGEILMIGPELEKSGTLESDVLDAGSFSYWGRLSSETKGSGTVAFETRSGNLDRPQKNWSAWAKLNNGRVNSPPARFLQYRMTLSAQGSASPEVEEVTAAYQMRNVAPVISDLEITLANYKFPAPSSSSTPSKPSVTLPALGHRSSHTSSLTSDSSTTLTYAKGQIGVRWLATDENDDSMVFRVEIRGVNETTWKLLKDKVHEQYFSWDSTAFPDGKYIVRITASDSPSNPPDQALSTFRETDPFLIDNTAPEITGLKGTPSGNKVEISFHAKDGLSVLDKAEFSINGGDWMVVEPATRLTDSTEEDYRVTADRAPGEMTIAVRVSDEYDNEAAAKIVVK